MNMYEVLMPLAILGPFGMGLYFFTKTLTDYYLKKKMVEKGFVNEENQSVFKDQTKTDKYSALKWGLITFFGAIGLILIDFIPTRVDSPLPVGVFGVCLSLGFLTYFLIVKQLSKKD